MKRTLLLVAATAISGCATAVTGRNDPPRVQFETARDLDAATACVVAHMSAHNIWNYPFFARIVVPGQAYEVHPGREIMAGGEPIFVKVEALPSGRTSIKGFSLRTMTRNFNGLQQACG